MLERLFGSRTRVILLKLLFSDPEKKFFVRELTRETGERINSIRRELDNLLKLELIKEVDAPSTEDKKEKGASQRKYYSLDKTSSIYPELKNLVLKTQMMGERKLFTQLLKKGRIKKLYLYGEFVDDSEAPIDMLIVGQIAKNTLNKFMKDLRKKLGRSIRYTFMTSKEYDFRNNITDRFLLDLAKRERIIMAEEDKKS